MVVAAILVLLAGIAAPQIINAFEDARLQKMEVDAKQVLSSINRYVIDDRLKGGINRDIVLTSMTISVLNQTYGMEIAENDNVTYSFNYFADDGKAYVEATYNGMKYRTDQAAIGWTSD